MPQELPLVFTGVSASCQTSTDSVRAASQTKGGAGPAVQAGAGDGQARGRTEREGREDRQARRQLRSQRAVREPQSVGQPVEHVLQVIGRQTDLA